MERIAIYGGSFNPPHNGHVLAARECIARLSLDRLIVIPNAIPPHKDLPKGTPTAEQRFAMAQLAFEDEDRIVLSDMELKREGTSYTSDTVLQLSAEHPDDRLFLLMGTDMFLHFDSWHDVKTICERCTLVCMHRADESGQIQQLLKEKADLYRKQYDASIEFADNAFVEISSTDVRRLVRFGCAEEYLPQKVLNYIWQNNLYDSAENWKNLSFEQLKEKSLSLHNESRKAHVIGCSELAAELAKKYGLSEEVARRAGILHDVTKALPGHAQYAMCRHYHVRLSEQEQENAKLLHAITGAVAAQVVFGESEEVCMAIRWHTTGHGDMTTMEKILYIADYAECNRNFPGVERLRSVLKRSLDRAVLLGIEMTIRQLEEKNQPICDHTRQAYAFLQAKGYEAETI